MYDSAETDYYQYCFFSICKFCAYVIFLLFANLLLARTLITNRINFIILTSRRNLKIKSRSNYALSRGYHSRFPFIHSFIHACAYARPCITSGFACSTLALASILRTSFVNTHL